MARIDRAAWKRIKARLAELPACVAAAFAVKEITEFSEECLTEADRLAAEAKGQS